MGVSVTFATTLARVSTGQGGQQVATGRRPRPSRIVAVAGGERSGWHRLDRSLGRKRGPVRCVHHGKCGPVDRAIADGEPGSHRSRAAGHPRESGPVESEPHFGPQAALLNAPSVADAVRSAAGHTKQRSCGRFAAQHMRRIIRERCVWRNTGVSVSSPANRAVAEPPCEEIRSRTT